MKIDKVMTQAPETCVATANIGMAAKIMQKHDTGIVPVVHYEKDGRSILVGVVTDRDLCLKVLAQGRDPEKTTIAQCMTEHPVMCKSTDTTETVMNLMRQHQVRRIPVVDDKKDVIGIVSLADIIRHRATTHAGFCRTMAAIMAQSKPRSVKRAA